MKHQFALYYKQASGLPVGTSVTITDKEFLHRLTNILRAHVGDTYILFDQTKYANVLIQSIGKKEISIDVQSIETNTVLKPQITFMLPVLKKDALSEIVYALCEIGVNAIQLINTQKTRSWGGQKELERLQRVIIAAAEQSKKFAFPDIYTPIALESYFAKASKDKQAFRKETFAIIADPNGHAALDVIKDLQDSSPQQLILTVGPESAFTDSELSLLKEKKFHFMKLTPTILRARQAAALLSGIIRSF